MNITWIYVEQQADRIGKWNDIKQQIKCWNDGWIYGHMDGWMH